ncbi:hypothetical protein Sste5346_008750 [Sporothrix stenoceras]|uniref:RING-type E3 ubiquitin transferase n=1 Tax=Sporothrix stenoceras TaxID=5173 RepID=A0ABR3YNW6_9PEZI
MADGGGASSTGGGGGGDNNNNSSSSQRQPRRGGGGGGGEGGGGGRDGGGRGRGRGGGGRGRGEGGGRGGGRGGGGRGGDSSSQQQGSSDGQQRRRGGGSGRGGRHGGGDHRRHASGDAAEGDNAVSAPQPSRKDPLLRPPQPAGEAGGGGEDGAAGDDDAEVCFICANPVIHHAIAPCNHLTCHICALRMRALYRTKDCPHCRTPAPYVIFTDDPARRFEDYTDADISSTDDNIGIKYTNEDIVGDTVLLLRYNCPDEICDYAGFGWPDLHRHVRSTHHKKMCDLCTRNKKVFTHEHELFSEKAHEKHMRHGDDKPGAVDQTGFRGHPLCGFCGERFYDDDKLYEHCRNKHERCFICDRRDSRQPHYYRNYNELEKHFKKDHYICSDRECLEKKFVVFEAELDLKAHQLSEHGNTLSKDVRRDVQVVSMADFDFRGGEGRGGHGGGRSHQGRASRGRDPNADAPVATGSSSQSMRRDEIAYQRQLAIHSAQSISNRTFGSHLSSPAPTPAQASRQASPANANAAPRNPPQNSSSPAPSAPASTDIDPMSAMSAADLANLSPADRARLVRHGAVIERASNLLGSNPAKVNAFRYNISSYRSGARSATQLIDAFSTLFSETSDTALGSLVREVADLFDDAGKADALRKALHDRRAAAGGAEGSVQEDYPSLPTLGGMHGATTSTSGWAAAASANAPSAANHTTSTPSTRVLRLKHSTRLGGPSTSSSVVSTPSSRDPSGRTVPGATWTAPSSSRPSVLSAARPQAASAAFPALPSVAGKKAGGGSSWVNVSGGAGASTLASRVGSGIGGSSNSAGRYASLSAPGSGASTPAPLSGSRDAFPALPAAPKPPPPSVFGYGRKAVRRDLGGGNQETGFSWGGEGEASSSAAPTPAEEDESGKGKKKGRAGKKVLVQWG